MFDDKIYAKFRSLCEATADVDGDPLRIAEIRQIVLFRSNGLCPARLLVSSQDGALMSRGELCSKETYDWAKRKSWLESRNYEKLKDDALKYESKFIASTSYKCSLTSQQTDELRNMAEKCDGNCKAFRKQLLSSKHIETVAIHIFRWDGTPRASIAEIEKAICIYPASPRKMQKFLKFFFKVVVGVVVLGLVADHFLNTFSGNRTTLVCRGVNIHLIGEKHDRKLPGSFLPEFVSRLQAEGNKPQTAIYVELRQHEIDRLRISNPLPQLMDPFMFLFKHRYSPATFWGAVLTTDYKDRLLPHHAILSFDTRIFELVEIFKILKGGPKVIKHTFALSEFARFPVIQSKREEYASNSKLVQDVNAALNDQIRLIDSIIQRDGHSAGLLQVFRAQLAEITKDFQRNFLTSPIEKATDILNRMWTAYFDIPNYMLVHLIQRNLDAHIAQGIKDIYVFAGDDHVPPMERLLRMHSRCIDPPRG